MAKPQISEGREDKRGGFRLGAGAPNLLDPTPKVLKQIRALGEIQCTRREISAVLGVSYDTLARFFTANPVALWEYEAGRQEGRASLRRTQFNLAKTNAGMAIFLGKNYLGQTDVIENLPPGGAAVTQEFRLALEDMTDAERQAFRTLLTKAVKPVPRDQKVIEGQVVEEPEQK